MAEIPQRPAPVRPVPPAINSPGYQPPPPPPGPKPEPGWRRGMRKAVPWILIVMMGTVVLQIALGAAMAVGGDYTYLPAHGAMAGLLHLLPLILLIVALLAKDWPAAGAGGAVLVLVFIQYPLIELVGAMRGLHVLNALLIFTIALLTMHERMPWVKRIKPAKPTKPAKAKA